MAERSGESGMTHIEIWAPDGVGASCPAVGTERVDRLRFGWRAGIQTETPATSFRLLNDREEARSAGAKWGNAEFEHTRAAASCGIGQGCWQAATENRHHFVILTRIIGGGDGVGRRT